MRFALLACLFFTNGMVLSIVTDISYLSWRSWALIAWTVVICDLYFWIKTHAAPSNEKQERGGE